MPTPPVIPPADPDPTADCAAPGQWRLLRQDDIGNVYQMARHDSRAEAEAAAAGYQARGHKQLYYVERA